MVTIEEKLKLFSKMVYDRIQKENDLELNKFNKEFGSILEEKRKEFSKEAEKIYSDGIRDVEREKNQVVSKVRVIEKRMLMEKRKEIFEDTMSGIFDYAREFVKSEGYRDYLINNIKELINKSDLKEFTIFINNSDINNMINFIRGEFPNISFSFKEADIIGGFKAEGDKGIRYDYSIDSKIGELKDKVGEKLLSILQ